MPKMKSVSSAKKRFTLTATGKIKRKHAFKNHILTKKSTKRKRNLSRMTIVDPSNVKSVKQMLCI
ncbi:MAG: 50S ribosomal protein L35 [Odoribacteraceae bacterium]|jgi:large subunit ribosomal protein L35|nr:50S ribosomal protein L35 [Odoribacteraceae bacterium]